MVAMNVWPTDGAAGSVATEARWRKMGRLWAPSAVAAGIGGELKPTLAGTNLTIADGACWVDGHYAELLGPQVLTVTANGLAVIRFDPAANSADLVYRDAVTVPAQSPTGTWELPIAQIVGSALVDVRAFHSSVPTGIALYTVLTADATLGTTNLAWILIPWPAPTVNDGNWVPASNAWRVPRTGWIEVAGSLVLDFAAAPATTILANLLGSVHVNNVAVAGLGAGRGYGLASVTAAAALPVRVNTGDLVTLQAFYDNTTAGINRRVRVLSSFAIRWIS